ncbi:MAG TPA: hypothetical protein VFO19_02585 [Vicinamibacterales bacterium]|nr:hypothetical protein [Vicinamibacterales bacterium]
MRIAFDLDGVLADLHEPFVREAIKLFPELDAAKIGAADIGASPDDETHKKGEDQIGLPAAASVAVSQRQSDAVWKSVAATDNFWETLKECEPGAIARLFKLSEERKWEVLFITSRPKSAGRTVQRQSQRWLHRQGFELPSVYVVHGSRGRVAAALRLDVVIDDRPDNCLDVVLESKAGAILVWRGPQGSVPSSAKRLGIAVVSSVAECLDALAEADRGTEPGLLDRLRRAFGLRTKAAAPFLR